LLKGAGCVTTYAEREITEKTDLCDISGRLNRDSVGWAGSPIINCNLKSRWLRKKKWNYWCVMSETCLFSATISNIDYVGMVFIYFLDYRTKKFVEKTVMTPFGSGCAMPPGVCQDVCFRNKHMDIQLVSDGSDTRLLVRADDFGGEKLNADIRVSYPEGYETLNVVIPWNERTFQFTSKHEGMSAGGSLQVGDRTYDLNGAFATLDFGRGIWPYRVSWNWANAGGIISGRRIGLNLGGQWTDNTGMNENAIVVDGKLSKISCDMVFEYDKSNLMKPWKIRDADSAWVDLVMTPFYERVAKSDLGIIVSEVHQMIGRFSGRVRTSDGQYVIFENLLGTAEDHFGKW
jgi:hypothetical protein